MRTLVIGTSLEAVERVTDELTAHGHDVVRCHESGDAPMPCNALKDGRRCPLESGVVDVAVTAHDSDRADVGGYEGGAMCALRHHVPLVGAGASLGPLEGWVTTVAGGESDLAAACEEAASRRLPRHGEVATRTARRALESCGVEPRGVGASVVRHHGALKVTIGVPRCAVPAKSVVATRVVGALRELDPHAASVDVSFLSSGS